MWLALRALPPSLLGILRLVFVLPNPRVLGFKVRLGWVKFLGIKVTVKKKISRYYAKKRMSFFFPFGRNG